MTTQAQKECTNLAALITTYMQWKARCGKTTQQCKIRWAESSCTEMASSFNCL